MRHRARDRAEALARVADPGGSNSRCNSVAIKIFEPWLEELCSYSSPRITGGPDENERLDPIILRSSMSASAGTHALPVQL
jgi:hypothetical protein